MIDRMSSRIAANPRNAAMIMLALLVALALVLVAILASMIDFDGLFDGPYDSSDTPLSLEELGVCWTVVLEDSYTVGDQGLEYVNISFLWGWEVEKGFVSWGGELANDTEQNALSTGSAATVESRLGSAYFEGSQAGYSIIIQEVMGDGAFGAGDSVTYRINTLVSPPLAEDTVYTFALVYHGRGFTIPLGEFSCALDDGKFYSWNSGRLNWQSPWWE